MPFDADAYDASDSLIAEAHGLDDMGDAGTMRPRPRTVRAAPTKDRLSTNQSIARGQRITSRNGSFYVTLQATDGNLVLYNRQGQPLWSPNKLGGAKLIMQSDGNLVLYDARNRALWATGKNGAGASVVMQDDGNFVVYRGGRAFWNSETQGGRRKDDRGWAARAVGSVGDAVSSVGHAVGSVGREIGGALYALSPVSLVSTISQIAHGARVDRAVMNHFKSQIAAARTLAPYVQTIVSVVPGVGTGAAAAIAAGAALAEGRSITDSVLQGVRGALPGGRVAQVAFDTATRAIVTGQRIDHAALDAVRNQLPKAARPAFDVGVAVATGKSLQHALMASGKRAVGDFGGAIASRALTAADPLAQFGQRVVASTFSHLKPAIGQVSQALLKTPALRSMPIAELAKRFGTHEHDAIAAVAAVVGAVSRVPAGRGMVPQLKLMPDFEKRLSSSMTMDHAMALLGSKAARPSMSASPSRGKKKTRRSKNLHNVRWKQLSDRLVAHIVSKVPAAKHISALAIASVKNPGRAAPAAGRRIAAQHKPAPKAKPKLRVIRGGRGARGFNDAMGDMPTIRRGSPPSDAVKQWQTILGVTADGKFGPQTEAATKRWQSSHGLVADGIVGPKTWAAALGDTPQTAVTPAALPSAAPSSRTPPTIRQGSTGTFVRQWQQIIGVQVDGSFGPKTKSATMAWQRAHGLTADGIVGPKTWAAAAGSTPGSVTIPEVVITGSPSASTPSEVSSPHILQAQMLVAAWGKTTTRKISPADYGGVGDLNGLEDERFHQAILSFQRWIGPSKLRQDGDLDDPTYQELVDFASSQVEGGIVAVLGPTGITQTPSGPLGPRVSGRRRGASSSDATPIASNGGGSSSSSSSDDSGPTRTGRGGGGGSSSSDDSGPIARTGQGGGGSSSSSDDGEAKPPPGAAAAKKSGGAATAAIAAAIGIAAVLGMS